MFRTIVLVPICALTLTIEPARATDVEQMFNTLVTRNCNAKRPVEPYKNYEDYCGTEYKARMSSPTEISVCEAELDELNETIWPTMLYYKIMNTAILVQVMQGR
jgi:hypothetical protein